MEIAVVGLGNIGTRHIKNLYTIDSTIKITTLCDIPYENKHYDAALITNPAPMHIKSALKLAESGVHLFVEKPISDTLSNVDKLIKICNERNLVLMVGYNFHYYRPLKLMQQAIFEGRIGRIISVRAEVGQYLPEWRPGDYRQQVSANKSMGGGAIFELSHELDYVRALVGEVNSVYAQARHLSDLDVDVEDIAEINVGFENGAIGSIHLDMVQRPLVRTCKVIGTKGVIEWDWSNHHVKLFSNKSSSWKDLYLPCIIDRNEMYLNEMRHFLEGVNGKSLPLVDGLTGKRVLEIALAAKTSAANHREVIL